MIFYFFKKKISIKQALIQKKRHLQVHSAAQNISKRETLKNKGCSGKPRCPGVRPLFLPHSYALQKLPKRRASTVSRSSRNGIPKPGGGFELESGLEGIPEIGAATDCTLPSSLAMNWP